MLNTQQYYLILFVLTRDTTDDGVINLDDLQWDYLEGDGDFRSDEVMKIRDEADVIVTNPPFSLFREFFKWITDVNKEYVIIANKNCVTYKEVFHHIMNNTMWIGYHPMGQDMLFDVPEEINFGVNSTKYNTCIKSYLTNNNTSYTMNYSAKSEF